MSPPSLTDNKRLDEWVTADKLDIDHIQLPRKDSKSQPNPTTPASTAALVKNTSRAVSPDTSGASSPLLPPDTVTGRRSSVASGRKRKLENDVSPLHLLCLLFFTSISLSSLSVLISGF